MMNSEQRTAGSTVLFFEFVDGELKPKLNRKKGYLCYIMLMERVTADKRDLKLPEFTPAAMTRLINKRNQKFRQALNNHIVYSKKVHRLALGSHCRTMLGRA